jgi:hypothetical protein
MPTIITGLLVEAWENVNTPAKWEKVPDNDVRQS